MTARTHAGAASMVVFKVGLEWTMSSQEGGGVGEKI